MRFAFLLVAAMTAAAGSTHASSFDGFYVGGQLGHNSTDIKVTENWTPATYDGFSADGAEYGVFAGYGRTFDGPLYLGAELEVNSSSAVNKIATATDTLKTEKERSYGIAARAGYAMDSVMPYVRVGYSKAKFKQTLTGTIAASDDESKGGIALGAGIEVKATDNVAFRGEFVRTSYGKITETSGANTITYDPTENVARVGVSVRF